MNEDLEIYLRVREKEGRLYTDEIARQLPEVPSEHPLLAEWSARAASSRRLVAYLGRFREPLAILELGCGNGWLASRMASGAGASVVGLDRDGLELRQARRVFARRRELSWVAGDILCAPFRDHSFNVIVIASAIQYFPDVPRLIQSLLTILSKGGEIHILDSPFYSAEELPRARERSRTYYERLGFPEMSAYYHHHPSTVLDAYHPVWLYSPSPELKDSPFPWIHLRF